MNGDKTAAVGLIWWLKKTRARAEEKQK